MSKKKIYIPIRPIEVVLATGMCPKTCDQLMREAKTIQFVEPKPALVKWDDWVRCKNKGMFQNWVTITIPLERLLGGWSVHVHRALALATSVLVISNCGKAKCKNYIKQLVGPRDTMTYKYIQDYKLSVCYRDKKGSVKIFTMYHNANMM
jgi:hypothetical protein